MQHNRENAQISETQRQTEAKKNKVIVQLKSTKEEVIRLTLSTVCDVIIS